MKTEIYKEGFVDALQKATNYSENYLDGNRASWFNPKVIDKLSKEYKINTLKGINNPQFKDASSSFIKSERDLKPEDKEPSNSEVVALKEDGSDNHGGIKITKIEVVNEEMINKSLKDASNDVCQDPECGHGKGTHFQDNGIYECHIVNCKCKKFKPKTDDVCENCGFEEDRHSEKGDCQIYDMATGDTIRHFNHKKFKPKRK